MSETIKSLADLKGVQPAQVMAGSVASLPIVWSFADIANALMAIPNLISLLVLNKVIVDETKKYLWEKST